MALHDDQGQATKCFIEQERIVNLKNPRPNEEKDYVPGNTWTVSEDGELIIGSDRDKYRFRWIRNDGTTVRIVEREFDAYHRTEADIEEIQKKYTPHGSNEAVAIKGDYCTHEPVLTEIRRISEGRLLVETSFSNRELPNDVVYRYEVHEPTGELEASVQIHDLAGDYDPKVDGLVLAGEDLVVVLRNLYSAFQSAEAFKIPADLREQELPDLREDTFFSVVVYDLVEMQ